MKIIPLADRVVIKTVEVEETTKGGLILTGSAKEKPQVAQVVAVAADQVGLHELGRFLGESLRVAAGEDGDGAGVLALGPAEPLAALLVAEVGDGAAVHHKDVGLFALRYDGETGGAEHLFQRTGLI